MVLRIVPPKSRRDQSPFIGRRQERERLRAELGRGAGLVSLVGPSGIGKTRLAQQVADELVDTYDAEGGVWFCSLTACREPADLEASVSRALELQQQQGGDLARSIANRGPLLLILDNADPIASLIGQMLEGWLERCVELQIIVTSLIPVEIPGETIIKLRPLEQEDAVALYLDRARRAWADRSFLGDEVEDLVRRLDRIPLAIELAATRVRILPPRTMLSMFEKRFEFLRSNSSQDRAGARQSSLIGAIDLTWSYLAPEERWVLAHAAVFEGSFTAEMCSAVSKEEQPHDVVPLMPPERVIELLDDLYQKSLLLTEDTEPLRYYLLESVRKYALEQLRQMGREEDALRRHAAYLLGHEEAQLEWGRGQEQVESIRWLKQERTNLVSIHHRFLQTDPSIAARAGIALAPLTLQEGQSSNSDTKLSNATLDAARRSGEPKLILRALETSSIIAFRSRRYETAKAVLKEQAELARQHGEVAVEVLAYSLLARLHMDRGDLDGSREPLAHAVSLSDGLGLPRVEANLRLAQGVGALWRNDYVEAEAHFLRSVDLFSKESLSLGAANALHHLSLALANQGRHEEMRSVMGEAIEITQRLGNSVAESHFLTTLAGLDFSEGLLDEAEKRFKRCLQIVQVTGNHFGEGVVCRSLGIISLERGDLAAASEWLSRAEEVFTVSGATTHRLEFLLFLAVLEARLGNAAEARRILDELRASAPVANQIVKLRIIEGAEALVDMATARLLQNSDRQQAALMVENARSRYASLDAKGLRAPSYIPIIRRMLLHEFADWEANTPPAPRASTHATLEVNSRRDCFQIAGGKRAVLHNRRVLHRVFRALIQARLEDPGGVVRSQELVRIGWPQIEMSKEGGAMRLKGAIWSLRDLGLRSILKTHPYGYLIDPAVSIQEQADDPVVDRLSSIAERVG